MLTLYYEGWFQCRLATDPDPSDDPHGVSGPTFAAPGEPDLDRIIRLQNPVTPRYPHDTDIGVNVRRVTVNEQEISNHPLLGAAVDLVDAAKFEGRNFIIAGTGREPIDPFHIQITGHGVTLDRIDCWNPQKPTQGILEISPEVMARRQPTFIIQSAEVAEATGIMDYAAFRAQRLSLLQERIKKVTDPIEQAALAYRIDALQKDGEDMFGITSFIYIIMGVQETFQFGINGQATVTDPANALGGVVGTSQEWPIKFWMGGYDVDTLVAYMRGSVAIPFYPTPRQG